MNEEQHSKHRAGEWGSSRQQGYEPSPLRTGFALLGNMVLCCMLLPAAILRETPEFWLNTGGYPVLLRECVYWLFYPALLVCLFGLAVGAWQSCRVLCQRPGLGCIFVMVCGVQILVLAAVVVILL